MIYNSYSIIKKPSEWNINIIIILSNSLYLKYYQFLALNANVLKMIQWLTSISAIFLTAGRALSIKLNQEIKMFLF